MKSKVIFIAAIVLCLALSITGGTYAYFATQGIQTNALTMGRINITILETYNPEDAKQLVPTPATHPKKVQKEVRIQNQGGEAFVRVKFLLSWGDVDGQGVYHVDPTLATDNIRLEMKEGTLWQEIGGSYYCLMPSAKDNGPTQSDVLLQQFSMISTPQDNAYKGKTAHIDVIADAVQVGSGAIDALWDIHYDQETGLFSQVMK